MNEYELLTIPCALLLMVVFVWSCDPSHESRKEVRRDSSR